jgi:hypothetical protein
MIAADALPEAVLLGKGGGEAGLQGVELLPGVGQRSVFVGQRGSQGVLLFVDRVQLIAQGVEAVASVGQPELLRRDHILDARHTGGQERQCTGRRDWGFRCTFVGCVSRFLDIRRRDVGDRLSRRVVVGNHCFGSDASAGRFSNRLDNWLGDWRCDCRGRFLHRRELVGQSSQFGGNLAHLLLKLVALAVEQFQVGFEAAGVQAQRVVFHAAIVVLGLQRGKLCVGVGQPARQVSLFGNEAVDAFVLAADERRSQRNAGSQPLEHAFGG